MRGKVLHDADVANARGEGRLATRRDLLDLAKLALRDAPTHVDECGIAALDVADSSHEARGRESIADAPTRLDARGERLFDEGVHPGLGEREGRSLVVGGGSGDDRGVNTCLDELLDATQHGQVTRNAEAVTARVSERDEVHAGGRARVAHMVSTHRADTEDSQANSHVRPPLPRAR